MIPAADVVLRAAPCAVLAQDDALVGDGVEVVDAGLHFRVFLMAEFLVIGAEPEHQ